MSRREAAASALIVFAVAIAAGFYATQFLTFPRPEDVAYYVGVARNIVDGRGLTSDVIWSYATPPLAFPRPAFEVWLPMASFVAAVPMAILGTSFRVAQLSSVLIAGITAVLAWRLGADIAIERGLSAGRARALGLGSGLTAAVYLPLVIAGAEPDSTIPFAAVSLGTCLLRGRLVAGRGASGPPSTGTLAVVGLLLGLAALTRNEAVWLALTWVVVARQLAPSGRDWFRAVAIPAVIAIAVFLPWAVRDWIAFGSPFPGQALTNALSLDGRDIFAWQDQPTVARYLDAGIGTLLALRWVGFVHNLGSVLLLLGFPVSLIGLIALPATIRRSRSIQPLALFAAITFAVTTLVFPVSTTWGTFLHAAGATYVLLIVAALVGTDLLLVAVGRRRGWTRPVAWLGPVLTIGAASVLTIALLRQEGTDAQAMAARYGALPAALASAGAVLEPDGAPVISDHPIWLAESTGTRALALPYESLASVLDLAQTFGARLLVIDRESQETWPEILDRTAPGSECFVPLILDQSREALRDFIAYRIGCP